MSRSSKLYFPSRYLDCCYLRIYKFQWGYNRFKKIKLEKFSFCREYFKCKFHAPMKPFESWSPGCQPEVNAFLSHDVNKLSKLFSVDDKPADRTAGGLRRGTSCPEIAARYRRRRRTKYAVSTGNHGGQLCFFPSRFVASNQNSCPLQQHSIATITLFPPLCLARSPSQAQWSFAPIMDDIILLLNFTFIIVTVKETVKITVRLCTNNGPW